jgi:hypothetical protein
MPSSSRKKWGSKPCWKLPDFLTEWPTQDLKLSFRKLYLSKHPYLKEFVSSPTCALLRMDVETYYVVHQFQNVMELHIRK